MKKKFKIIFTFILIYIFIQPLFAKNSQSKGYIPKGISYEVATGVVFPLGYIGQYLYPGPDISLGVTFPFWEKTNNLQFKIELDYKHWPLQKNISSLLFFSSLRVGLEYKFFVHRFFQPFVSILAEKEFIFVMAKNIDEYSFTAKTGAVLQAGFLSYLNKGFYMKFYLENSFTSLSKDYFNPLSLKVGAVFNYDFYKKSPILSSKENFQTNNFNFSNNLLAELSIAELNLKKGNLNKAEKIVSKILKDDKGNIDALNLIKKITHVKNIYKQANQLYAKKEYLNSLKLYNKISFFYPAQKKISLAKEKLFHYIKLWERQGKSFYQQKQYTKCMIFMQNILLVDKNNSTAKIYLPRAEKRKKALEKLR